MPVHVYVMYTDPDWTKLAPSKKNGIYTYTTEKIPVIGSCELLVIHPSTKCLKGVMFHIGNQEGSVIVSCVTSISLNLMQIHCALNTSVPDCRQLIYSCADDPDKYRYKIKSGVHVCNNVWAREFQPPKEHKVVKTEVAQWKNQVSQEKYKEQKSQEFQLMRPVKPQYICGQWPAQEIRNEK